METIESKKIVVPGEVLATGMDFLPSSGTFRDKDKIISIYVGLTNISGRVIRVIPLRGRYIPKRDDTVIGRIIDMTFSNWFIDMNCANIGVLSVREISEFVERGADLADYFSYGDYIVCKISKVTRASVDLTMRGPGLRKLGPGKLITIDSSKVPRIIGKQGSMISMIKEKTNCRIVVGQNGTIWIQGAPEDEMVAAEAIYKINQESHREGLTEEIAALLEKKISKNKPMQREGEEQRGRENHEEE
ncbi:KH domain-containing protein [Candidatus Woesearchaeota archaeon]|nr:KH domain-containing protein [Candidatus Woesearchaeota archaeon]